MTLVTPANAKGPVPVLMMFGRAGFPNPNEPRGEELDRINAAWKALLLQQDPSLKEVFAQHPAWEPVKESPLFQPPQLNADGDPPNDMAARGCRLGLCAASIRPACRPITAPASRAASSAW